VAHQHYKGTGQMHSFRGLLADGEQQKIRIEGATGQIAWRITKFELFPNNPGATIDANVKVWRESPDSATSTIDFNDDKLLAAAMYYNGTYEIDHTVVFDNALFTRNIYVQHHEQLGSDPINFYIELEEVKVGAAGMAQLAVAAARRT
jgi:hypothetical protein